VFKCSNGSSEQGGGGGAESKIKNFNALYHYIWVFCFTVAAAIAQSVQRLATGWTVRGSSPGGGARSSVPVQTGSWGSPSLLHNTGPWGPPSLLHNAYPLFTGAKATAGLWYWPPTPLPRAEVAEGLELYLRYSCACTDMSWVYLYSLCHGLSNLLKADLHIACCAHAVPMPLPCHAVPLRV